MKTPTHTIDEYRQIESDVWQIFKKYFDDDANLMEWSDDVHRLDEKYKKDVRQYCFMQGLLKIHFDELNELKEVKGINWT